MRTGEVFALTWDDIDLENRIIKIKKTVYAKDKENNILGFITAKKFLTSKSGEIGSLYVNPEIFGKGIGKALIEEILEWFNDINIIKITVASYNDRAINFYHKFE